MRKTPSQTTPGKDLETGKNVDLGGLESRRDCLLCPARHVIYRGPTLQILEMWIVKEEGDIRLQPLQWFRRTLRTYTEGMGAGGGGKEERIKGTRKGEGEGKEERDILVNTMTKRRPEVMH